MAPSEARLDAVRLASLCGAALRWAGDDFESGNVAVQAMMHASRLGVDGQSVRRLPHRVAIPRCGRVDAQPDTRLVLVFGAL